MASKKVIFFVESTEECPTGTALNAASTESPEVSMENSLPMDPLRNETPTESNGNPSTRLLSSTHPQYSTIEVPVPANGQPIGPGESARERCTNKCTVFLDWYKESVIEFRNSFLMHIVHLLFAHIPISALVMGLMFDSKCPHTQILPTLITLVGLVSVVFMGFWIAVSCCEHSGTPWSYRQKMAFATLAMPLFISMVVEMCLVFRFSPSFNPADEDYCSEMFYRTLVGREIFSAAAIVILALIYLPGSGLLRC